MVNRIFFVRQGIVVQMFLCRASLAGIFLALAFCSAILGVAYAERAQPRPLLLDRGTLRGYQWTVELTRDAGKHGGQRPCLISQIVDTRRSGTGETNFTGETGLKACSVLAPTGPPTNVNLTVGDGNREVTVFGMAFAPQVASIDLDFGPDGHMRVKVKKLNSVQIRNAEVRSVSYAAFALKGNKCLRQTKAFGPAGNEIFRGPIDECPELGPGGAR